MGRRTAVVDSSVLIAFLARDDAHHEAAIAAMEGLAQPPIVPVIVYAEVMVGASGEPRTRRKVERFFDTTRVEPLTRSIASRGAMLRARTGVSLADALVVATGQELNVGTILTADGRWSSLDRRVQVVGDS
jgi:predicted nucleic acid-binding protein